ncbi:Bug family tripartite tricarboxylate transporter substrate binding protein [Ramlibacter tataouinensis]|uniref:Candidate extracytoplasmic binding receptor n=1 Tax=Ramlibacter tataouinensis (strain ATCC BAA-407 / DSM 14655 / LMG 21543 / TTB310) TaxID=365046 RepID=F5Y1S2_RAMTT|nr:tripartite tricarboxylate transporter substrate binding protein [Ramlibacter tataouinensis]AEG92323.1 Candidate extracytoplasmic binding receptor [Ramlibacter tataouinensis TTB310]
MNLPPPALSRRSLLAGLSALALPVRAQAYPSKPVTVVVPYAAGGTTDIVARLAAHSLSTLTGKTFVVENKGGGSTTIATGLVAKAPADGYTLLANEMTQTIVPALFPKLPFDPIRDLAPVTVFAEAPYVLVVNAKVPANNLRELVQLAKAQPGKLNFASGGAGSGPHIAGELLKAVAGIDMAHVAYKGSGPAVSDLLGGQVEVLITAAPTVAAQMGSGRMRPLAVAHGQRLSSLPDVPTAAEAGFPGFLIANWFGLAAPKGTPAEVIAFLHAEVQKMIRRPEVREKLVAAGAEPVAMTPDQAARHIDAEARRWGELIRKAGIKVD